MTHNTQTQCAASPLLIPAAGPGAVPGETGTGRGFRPRQAPPVVILARPVFHRDQKRPPRLTPVELAVRARNVGIDARMNVQQWQRAIGAPARHTAGLDTAALRYGIYERRQIESIWLGTVRLAARRRCVVAVTSASSGAGGELR